VRGLHAGGDDFPARVDALAHRSTVVARETILRVGDLEMDLLGRTVRRSGREIELRPKEFKLLEYLARNAGRIVSRTMLLERAWDLHLDPMKNAIDVYVGRLRRKVDGAGPPLIHTVRGVGFCLRVSTSRRWKQSR
jgi:two-component system OmpR family response regulator